MDTKPVVALGFAGGVFLLQIAAEAQGAKVDLIPLQTVNSTSTGTSPTVLYNTITDEPLPLPGKITVALTESG